MRSHSAAERIDIVATFEHTNDGQPPSARTARRGSVEPLGSGGGGGGGGGGSGRGLARSAGRWTSGS